ncbi:MAG: hypothetical protein R3F54_23835 [Alphaproteobacteria bacterium]
MDDGTQFEDTRFALDLIAFHGIAGQMTNAVGDTAELSVDGKLAQRALPVLRS